MTAKAPLLLPPLTEFLAESPTAFHAAGVLGELLRKRGFQLLDPRKEWRLEPGKGYFLLRNGSSLAAFRTPKAAAEPGQLRLCVSHTDSPCLKLRLKDAKQQDKELLRIPVEVYGGATLPTWPDRPLRLAGRMAARDKKGASQIVVVDSRVPVATVPNPPIHLANLNDGFHYNPQTQLAAFLPAKSRKDALKALLPRGLEPDGDAPLAELYLVDAEAPTVLGDLVQSPRLDNLVSCYALAGALCDPGALPDDVLAMGAFFDLEETGLNYQSAGSDFLRSLLERIAAVLWPRHPQALPRLLGDSLCVSLDVAHAFHPNFPELFVEEDAPKMGHGPALKFHANQNYSTVLPAAQHLRLLAEKNALPLQTFTPRSGAPCGSTIGRIVSGALGIPSADVGTPLWAMHSARETGSLQDTESLQRLLAAFFQDDGPLPPQ